MLTPQQLDEFRRLSQFEPDDVSRMDWYDISKAMAEIIESLGYAAPTTGESYRLGMKKVLHALVELYPKTEPCPLCLKEGDSVEFGGSYTIGGTLRYDVQRCDTCHHIVEPK